MTAKPQSDIAHGRLEALGKLVDGSPAVIFLWQIESGHWPVEVVSSSVQGLLGYSPEDFMSGRMSWPGVTHPEDVPRLEREVSGLFAAGRDEWSQQYRLIAKDGRTVWVEDWNRVLRDADGKVTHIQALVMDITERKRAEAKLVQNYETQAATNALLSLSMEDMPVTEFLASALNLILSLKWLAIESKGCIFLADEAGKILYLRAQRGMPDALLTMCSTLPFGHCLCGRAAVERTIQFADCVDARHEVRYAGMPPHGHYCVPILSGHHVLGVLNLYVKEGHNRDSAEEAFLKGVANTMAGVIERKQAEAALKESKNWLSAVLDNDPTGIVVMNAKTRVISDANPAALGMLGLTKDEVVGKVCHGFFCPADVGHCPILDEGQVVDRSERIMLKPDGKRVPILKTVVPIRLQGEDCLLESFIDISERKRAEEERSQLQAQLVQSQKLESIGTLACGMGHEINNPIMGIINYAQLIKDRLCGKDANVEEFAGEIAIEAERIAGIVRGLSAFATRDTTARVSIPVTDLIESALAPLRDPLTHDHITLTVEEPDDLPSVSCDRVQIAQVLTSLLNNARDALNERYPGHDADKKIIVAATAMTNDADRRIRAVRLTVEDHGTGIPPGVREHIFEPFFTTKDKSVGAGNIGKGLGLFISYATVQEHGGSLTVETDPGQWTWFCIDLPAEAQAERKQTDEEVHEGGSDKE